MQNAHIATATAISPIFTTVSRVSGFFVMICSVKVSIKVHIPFGFGDNTVMKNFKNTKNSEKRQGQMSASAAYESPMTKVREIIPVIAQQAGDPLGSYTGSFADPYDRTPIQDADDL
jgi:hypothetical protein